LMVHWLKTQGSFVVVKIAQKVDDKVIDYVKRRKTGTLDWEISRPTQPGHHGPL
jgi:hypothetical protein